MRALRCSAVQPRSCPRGSRKSACCSISKHRLECVVDIGISRLGLVGGLLLSAIVLHAAPAQESNGAGRESALPAPLQSKALVDRYCVTCHSQRLKTGNLVLQDRDFDHIASDAGVWEKAVRKVRVGMMPPP